MALPLIIPVIVAAFAASCSAKREDKELPSLDNYKYDAGSIDGGKLDGNAFDAGDAVGLPKDISQGVAWDAVTVDSYVEPDIIGQADQVDMPDAVSEDGAGLAEDATSTGDTASGDVIEADASPAKSTYSCKLTAEDKYGMKFGMSIMTENPVVATNEGWSGITRFIAAEGTDSDLEEGRLTKPAETWPKKGQNIPPYSKNAVARYDTKVALEGYVGKVSITNRSVDDAEMGSTLFPMTWADDNGAAEPIKEDTKNEIYFAQSSAFQMAVTCYPNGCSEFKGTMKAGDKNWVKELLPNYISAIKLYCYEVK